MAFVIALLLMKSLDQQLGKLIDVSRRISCDKFQHRVDISDAQGSECNELGEAFNTMTQNLTLTQRQLVQSAAIGDWPPISLMSSITLWFVYSGMPDCCSRRTTFPSTKNVFEDH